MIRLSSHGASFRRLSFTTIVGNDAATYTHGALFSGSVGSAATKLNFSLALTLIHYYVMTMIH